MIVLNFRKKINKFFICCIFLVLLCILCSHLSNYITSFNKTSINYIPISNYILASSLPAMEQVSFDQSISDADNNFLYSVLNLQLPILNSLNYIAEMDENDEDLLTQESQNLESKHAEVGANTQVVETNVPNTYTDSNNGVFIKNGTNYEISQDIWDTSNLDINKNDIIIFHSHTCESYTPTENYSYDESGNFRTTDLNYSVAKVGSVLSDQLLSYGFNVTHDTTYHDYPNYSGSYGRSMATVENVLLSHSGTDIIIDLHRDAIADSSYAPSVIIGNEKVSQLMFVIGTDGGGLEHPNWRNNLKFAIAVQKKANELYPGLFRSILLRNSRYNQQLGNAACIIEVGATGNTLEESMGAMKYLALVLNSVLH